jgi:hypothetical protein
MRARNMAKNAIFHGKMLFNKSSENSHTGTSKYKSSFQREFTGTSSQSTIL